MRARAVQVRLLALLGVTGCGGATADRSGHGIVETMAAESGRHAGNGGSDHAGSAASRPPLDTSFFRAYAESRGFRLGHPTSIRSLPDGSAVLFLRGTARDPRQSLYEMDVHSGKTRTVLSPDDVAKGGEVLTPAEKARRERMRVIATGFTSYELTGDASHVLVSLSGRLVFVERATGKWRELPIGDGAAVDPHLSPDGRSVAYLVGNDVFAMGIDDAKPHAVTRGGTDDLTHGAAEFVAQEELDRSRGFWWSPDSRSLLFEEADLKGVERWSLADPGRPANPAERIAYPRPGKKNAVLRFGLIGAHGGPTTWLQWDREAFPYVARVVWAKDAPPLLYVLDRAQKTGLLLAVDAKTGKTREILREHDDVFLEPDDESVPRVLPGGREALWSSERDGVSRLYRVDLASGALTAITDKGFGYRSLEGVDAGGTLALVSASTEPAESHVYAVPLSPGGGGTTPRRIDRGQLSSTSAIDDEPHPGVVPLREGRFGAHAAYLLRDLDGHELAKIPDEAEPPPFLPTTRLETIGPDEMRVAVTVPRHYDPTRKYPVVDYAYGGPHALTAQCDADRYFFHQMLADRVDGIVVSIDAEGTPFRGRDWERAIAGKFAEVPIEGHVTALHALAVKHPEMDLERVGVVGWSFGGYYAALAILRHPELYKVAVAGAPVADWKDYDTTYTERYLGVPGEGDTVYAANSLPGFASRPIDAAHPARPLLLVHGTADDNVYFVHGLTLAGALERAHRPFELYPLVGVTHMPVDPVLAEALWARVDDFLADHLR
jgi:dipeptidyl-peptidase-4